MRTRTFTLAAPVVAAAVAAVTAAGSGGSAGSPIPEVRAVAAVLPAMVQHPLEPLVGPQWRLVSITHRGREVRVPHTDAVTLRLTAADRFTLQTCNLMVGHIVSAGNYVLLRSEWGVTRACPGAAGRVDRLLHTALSSALQVRQTPGVVQLVAHGMTLHLRAPEPAQPPLDAVEVGRLDDERGNCTVLHAVTESGPRLFVLARTRAGGPWRLLPGGPVTPDSGAVRAAALDSLTPGSRATCVVAYSGGAARVGSARVESAAQTSPRA